jgi:hypothetical protein
MPPMMVAPERLVPGISAKAWAQPTLKASSTVMSSTDSTRAGPFCMRWRFSTHRITRPPAMKAIATGTGANSTALMLLLKMKPSIAAGTKATTRFSTNSRAR